MNGSDAMLQRYRAQSRDMRRRSATRRNMSDASDDVDVAADAAYDVTHYFPDDFADPWREGDALERERLSQHAKLRELVSRGDVVQLKAALASLGSNAGLVVNLTPGAANTLLYTACEAGLTSVVGVLLDAGADGRAHPITKYGPLYVACYQGHLEIARMLLSHFPRAVQQETVEKWLPLHAACIGGHAALVSLLLDYNYPQDMLHTYTSACGERQYLAAFDINARDASGQTALFIACVLNNMHVVTALLDYTVLLSPRQSDRPTDSPEPTSRNSDAAKALSPQRGGISLGIHAIVSKLTGGGGSKQETEDSSRLCPVCVDVVVNGESCVSVAVRANNARLLRRLLKAGAKPDAVASPPVQRGGAEGRELRRRSRSASAAVQRNASLDRSGRDGDDRDGWTALRLAARLSFVPLAEMLLDAGATDPSGRAASEAAANSLHSLLARILATKAYPDPDYKLDKSAISAAVLNSRAVDNALTYNARCPSTPVMVTWRDLRCRLPSIKVAWVRAAAMHVNPKLASPAGALLAITRIDVANNELRSLPPDLFTLLSLRYLNAAQNKLERLPQEGDPFEEEPLKGRGKRVRPKVYSSPALQELYLQDNRLEELPPALFLLPSLQTLDVSNNKLRSLPSSMWRAPGLRDMCASLNHLRDLPLYQDAECSSPVPQSPCEVSSSNNSVCEQPADAALSQSSSRSPSIEGDLLEDEDAPITIANRAENTVCTPLKCAHSWRGEVEPEISSPSSSETGSRLQALNLAHNQFTCVPPALACLAPSLARLNLAYNSLRTMSYVTSYPTGLRQLDLSHNEITCWPSLPQIDTFGSVEGDPLTCYCPHGDRGPRPRPRSGASTRTLLLTTACPARRHLRLDALRTLILSNNLLTRIQLTTDDDDGLEPEPRRDDDEEWGASGTGIRSRLVFPLLSMLDVSCNMLKHVPPAIYALTNLAVLNISGNKDITDLPPQMGMLTRLWSVTATGCSLQEPLQSLLMPRGGGGRSSTSALLRHLQAALHHAKPYPKIKLMLCGQQGIGKTSLLECLRQESAIHHRRKPTEHWAKRMGNKGSRRNLSTVGVDIGAWVYEKQRSTRGPVTFRTWDFGGQQEYYATHQYFLSRRSLYLVVWRATDGRKGLHGAICWLRSIQARAPGSPVVMVATHYDQVANCNLPESESPEALQRLIRCNIMGAADADKRGLPRVLDSIEVSCSSRHNIRLLADIIYSVAFSVKLPGSKEPLLQQPVPAQYLQLEECVTQLAQELTQPVLHHARYTSLVSQYFSQRGMREFRDAAELHQATMFLHENGVLLHYDDATLKELYFVRPQWLCDLLAHVVTVREINPFASQGVMRTEDLWHVFKASPLVAGGGEEALGLALSLLNKFELALAWDARLLLVPALLPAQPPAQPQLQLRSRTGRGAWAGTVPLQLIPTLPAANEPTVQPEILIRGRSGSGPLRRILVVSYVPRGFWPRLTARLLADATLWSLPARLYNKPPELELDESVNKALESNWGWTLWSTGVRLSNGELTLLQLQEIPPTRDPLLPPPDNEAQQHPDAIRYLVRSEGAWCPLDACSSARLELVLPAHTAILKRNDENTIGGYQSIGLEPNPETLAKALALVSDHVDLLLEDWYPSLGTRFVHTSEGRCLITRLVPCPLCLRDAENAENNADNAENNVERLNRADQALPLEMGAPRRLSQESRASDRDSGVGAESNASSRVGSVEGRADAEDVAEAGALEVYSWALEECILCACSGTEPACRVHGQMTLRELAPDTLLLDVEEDKRARWEDITRTSVAGRGAFGTVLAGAWTQANSSGSGQSTPVAVKALQPVPPPAGSDISQHHAYKAAASRWAREPVTGACRAYCGLRQELSVMQQLRHPHVLPLLAVCAKPLALLLPHAPMGALDGVLRQYRGCGARVSERVVRALALQLAKALEYLHAARILYRDLKSENVLVWAMPSPQEAAAVELRPAPINVHVKLGDYGISRLAPPSGTKGFGGTEGFMAPEIMRYNGEEEYNEKVDCFSYGMVLYEIISLRQPFEGHEAVKEAVLEGARPALTNRELSYPCNVVQLMRRCWSGRPELRPTAAALAAVAAAPEFPALVTAAMYAGPEPSAAVAIPITTDEGGGGWEVWLGGSAGRARSIVLEGGKCSEQHTLPVVCDKSPTGETISVTAICRVGSKLWLGDSAGRVSVYSASSCSSLWGVCVCEVVGGSPSPVAALLPLQRLQRVALALQCGRLFLVTSHRPGAEGGFVLSELGAATSLACLAAVPTPQGCDVWAGGDGLHAYSIWAGGVRAAHTIDTAAQPTLLAAHRRQPYVYGYTTPGVTVYQWSAVSREVTARLDCSKLAPCSESLHSMPELRDNNLCEVLSLCVCGSRVFVGTGAGELIVADAATLRPLTVCRVYERRITCIVALSPHEGALGPPMILTVGDSYRPLLDRFAPINIQQQNNISNYSGPYCLLWRAHHWLPD